MATKQLTPDQCFYLHQRFPPPNCCICNAKIEVEELKIQLEIITKRYSRLKNAFDRLQNKYRKAKSFIKALGIPK